MIVVVLFVLKVNSTAKTVEIATGTINRITAHQISPDAIHLDRLPSYSPDGKPICYLRNLENVGYGFNVFITSLNGGNGINLTDKLDRCFFRTEWSNDSKSIFVAANDFNTVSLWMQPLNGIAKKLNLKKLSIAGAYWDEL